MYDRSKVNKFIEFGDFANLPNSDEVIDYSNNELTEKRIKSMDSIAALIATDLSKGGQVKDLLFSGFVDSYITGQFSAKGYVIRKDNDPRESNFYLISAVVQEGTDQLNS